MFASRHHLILLLFAACGRSGAANDPPKRAPREEVVAPESRVIDKRGIELPGDAHGLYWDAESQLLYLVDDTHDVLVRWSDKAGFERVVTLPTERAFGDLARLADGRFAITVFGFGTEGRVYLVSLDGKVETIKKLDVARRRLGISVAPDGVLFVSYFLAEPGKPPSGGIALLDLERGETDLPNLSLVKPVGVVATKTTIYASDQHGGAIVAYDRETATARTIATITEPDLLVPLPNGELIAASRGGSVYRIDREGGARVVANGFEEVRGTAYDPAGKRLFVVEHSAATSQHRLHVVPLEPR